MASRTRVLRAFKEIHRTCQFVFAGDKQALKTGRWKINTEFKRFKGETIPKKIEDHIQWARDASRLLKLTAVQCTPVNTMSYEQHSEINNASYRNHLPFNNKPSHAWNTKTSKKNTQRWRHPDQDYVSEWGNHIHADHPRRQQYGRQWQNYDYDDDESFYEEEFYGNMDRHKHNHKRKPKKVNSADIDLLKMKGRNKF